MDGRARRPHGADVRFVARSAKRSPVTGLNRSPIYQRGLNRRRSGQSRRPLLVFPECLPLLRLPCSGPEVRRRRAVRDGAAERHSSVDTNLDPRARTRIRPKPGPQSRPPARSWRRHAIRQGEPQRAAASWSTSTAPSRLTTRPTGCWTGSPTPSGARWRPTGRPARLNSRACMQRQAGAAARDAAPAGRGDRRDRDRSGVPGLCRPLPPARRGAGHRLGRLRPGGAGGAAARAPAHQVLRQCAGMAGRRPLASGAALQPQRLPVGRRQLQMRAWGMGPGGATGAGRKGPCVVVGDGRSDFCMAARADFVIAKGALAGFCSARGLSHASFRNFDDVTERLAEWLDRREAEAGSRWRAKGSDPCPAACRGEAAWRIKAFA